MDYREGRIGRVFAVRFDHGDDFLEELTALARRERIGCAWFHLLGGIRRAEVVTGPKEPTMPPEPVWHRIVDPHEVVGMGSIFFDGETPKIHLHTVLGHHGQTLCACMRGSTEVYLILEAYITEITGIAAARPFFPEGGFHRVVFG
ncbi:MAG: DUF296 domain-containing protein [Thermodesulfobacteriota bacterium]